jgi:hypothetical protein
MSRFASRRPEKTERSRRGAYVAFGLASSGMPISRSRRLRENANCLIGRHLVFTRLKTTLGTCTANSDSDLAHEPDER